MAKKRTLLWLFFCIAMICILIGRLVQIQLVDSKSFSKHNINLLEESVKQRSQEMIVDTGRGNFIDRNGTPLTYDKIPVLILFPFLKKIEWPSQKIAHIIGVSETKLLKEVGDSIEPFAFGDPDPVVLSPAEVNKINSLKIPGVFAVERKYTKSKNPAEQLIGITGENISVLNKRYGGKKLSSQTLVGLSGLEESFDEFLVGEGKSKLVYHVDGEGDPLFGINVKYVEPANPFYPVNIKTTLDKPLQEIAENLADKHGIKKGGLILLDIESSSILAMVSRPNINHKDPFSDSGINNLMLKQHIIGSVFKTVVAAAAIDYQLDDKGRIFDCSKKINGQPDSKYDHGMLNFTDSFARSCNRTFGELATELTNTNPYILDQYSQKMSLTGPSGWQGNVYHLEGFKQLADEEKGRIFLNDHDRKDDNFAALSGIGQHEVRATPLGVANMMATIARGGRTEMVKAVSSIDYQNGTTLLDFEQKAIKGETLAPYTVMKLQQLLREVVVNEHGTGRWFKELPYETAGKSGTAETGIYVDGKQLHNKWFAGYFPFQNPKYALVTVNLGVFEDEGAVNPLFADMVQEIYDYNLEKTE
ncbi:peptidoglycan D,D-transpeptidase FtsI family protein [Bacillus sp. T33-2]|uniref:peptidoglycan D,D-transpeptidase FtsI family protein n=1 Tax=Bacillus sp. T33-2 TaxID=2054168 RepID=UPI000C77E5ED|nr:penicillin-binding transpeptidase domain-containing protein [Bacillus sp. T33-2]PLR93773.1 penicillin-binding protein [Bacillus sp. T33-2]